MVGVFHTERLSQDPWGLPSIPYFIRGANALSTPLTGKEKTTLRRWTPLTYLYSFLLENHKSKKIIYQ